MSARQAHRRRGGTFTFLIIAFSIILLMTGTLLSDATRGTYRLIADQAHESRAREACFGGVTWATEAVKESATGRGVLKLDHDVTVEVRYRTKGDRLEVDVYAKERDRPMRMTGVLVRDGEAWTLSEYKIEREKK